MTKFEFDTLETLLRMFQTELEDNGDKITFYGKSAPKEKIKELESYAANLKFAIMMIDKA